MGTFALIQTCFHRILSIQETDIFANMKIINICIYKGMLNDSVLCWLIAYLQEMIQNRFILQVCFLYYNHTKFIRIVSTKQLCVYCFCQVWREFGEPENDFDKAVKNLFAEMEKRPVGRVGGSCFIYANIFCI